MSKNKINYMRLAHLLWIIPVITSLWLSYIYINANIDIIKSLKPIYLVGIFFWTMLASAIIGFFITVIELVISSKIDM